MRKTTLAVIAVVILATVFALGFAAVTTHTSDAAQEAVPVAGPTAGTTAYEYMAELSDELGPRVAGLSTEVRAGDRIFQWFGDLGYAPDTQDFTFTEGDKIRRSRNIVAVKPGVSAKQIVIGAHYDSVSVGRGAFDNASGVALMMELADALRDAKTPYTLVFVAFGAEESGLRGSAYYVSEMSDQARADTVLMINFDSVATGDRLYCYSSKDAPWPQLALRSIGARPRRVHPDQPRPQQGLPLRHHRRLERPHRLPQGRHPLPLPRSHQLAPRSEGRLSQHGQGPRGVAQQEGHAELHRAAVPGTDGEAAGDRVHRPRGVPHDVPGPGRRDAVSARALTPA